MNHFCPFINGICNDECIFRGGNIDLPDDCDLYDAIKTLQSLQAPGNQIDIRLKSIEDKLVDIESNTGFDQTDSSYIKSEVEEIKLLIRDFIKNQ